jgi:hypothetical protein
MKAVSLTGTLRRLFRLLVIGILLASLLAQPKPASACSCVPPDPPPVAFTNAHAVFVGDVTAINDPTWLARTFPFLPIVYSSADPVLVNFQVSDSWKGVTTTTVAIQTAVSGASCGYTFEAGKQYVVYAYQSSGVLETNMCTRTNEVAFAAADLNYLNTLPKLILTPTASSPVLFYIVIGLLVAISTALLITIWLIRRKLAHAAPKQPF